MKRKSGNFVQMLEKRSVQEVRYKEKGARLYNRGAENYKFWWKGEGGEDSVGSS